MKKIFNNPFLIVLILAVLAIYALMTETSNSAELKIEGLKADNKILKDSVRHYKAHTDSLKKLIPTLKEKHIVNEALADKPIRRLKERIAENRPEVMIEIDSMAVVKAFVGDLDSLNMAQEHKIEVLKNDHLEDITLLNEIITSQDSTISKQDSIIVKQDEIITEQDKIIKRKKRIGKLTTIGIGVAFIVGLAIGI